MFKEIVYDVEDFVGERFVFSFSMGTTVGVSKVQQKSMKIVLEVFYVIEKIVHELKHEKGHI